MGARSGGEEWAAIAAVSGAPAPAGVRPRSLFWLCQKESAPRPVEEKKRFGGSVCASADLLPPAGEGWQSLAAVRDGNAPPLGKPPARGGTGIPPAPLPAAAHAPAKKQTAPSEAEGAEREAGQMRSCTPTTSAPSATGRQSQKLQKMIACPKAGQNRRLHRSADPRRAEARTRRSASKRSFLLDRAQPVFFSTRGKRKWGVHPAGPAPCGSRIPRGRRSAARPAQPSTWLISRVPWDAPP